MWAVEILHKRAGANRDKRNEDKDKKTDYQRNEHDIREGTLAPRIDSAPWIVAMNVWGSKLVTKARYVRRGAVQEVDVRRQAKSAVCI